MDSFNYFQLVTRPLETSISSNVIKIDPDQPIQLVESKTDLKFGLVTDNYKKELITINNTDWFNCEPINRSRFNRFLKLSYNKILTVLLGSQAIASPIKNTLQN